MTDLVRPSSGSLPLRAAVAGESARTQIAAAARRELDRLPPGLSRAVAARADRAASETALLALLCRLCRGGGCAVPLVELAARLGLHLSTARAALVRLERSGALEVERPGGGRANLYRIACPELSRLVAASALPAPEAPPRRAHRADPYERRRQIAAAAERELGRLPAALAAAIAARPDLRPSETAVLALLCRLCGEEGRAVSLGELAAELGSATRTVEFAVKALERAGAVAVERPGGRRANTFRIACSELAAAARSADGERGGSSGLGAMPLHARLSPEELRFLAEACLFHARELYRVGARRAHIAACDAPLARLEEAAEEAAPGTLADRIRRARRECARMAGGLQAPDAARAAG